MKKLNVFLIQDQQQGVGAFERNRASIEISGFLRVTNNFDWRDTLSSDCGYIKLLDAEALMVSGGWIDDADCRMVISMFHNMKKPIFHQDCAMRRLLDSYIKTIELQNLMGEFFYYSPLIKTFGAHYVGKPLSISHLRSKIRDRELVDARAIFCKVCRHILSMKLQDIAWLINRDYTSVINLLHKHDDWCSIRIEHEFQAISHNIICRLFNLQAEKA